MVGRFSFDRGPDGRKLRWDYESPTPAGWLADFVIEVGAQPDVDSMLRVAADRAIAQFQAAVAAFVIAGRADVVAGFPVDPAEPAGVAAGDRASLDLGGGQFAAA